MADKHPPHVFSWEEYQLDPGASIKYANEHGHAVVVDENGVQQVAISIPVKPNFDEMSIGEAQGYLAQLLEMSEDLSPEHRHRTDLQGRSPPILHRRTRRLRACRSVR